MSTTPRTKACAQSIRKSGVDWHYSAGLMLAHAAKLELELSAVTAERDALALPRPYDVFWSRRALAAEARVKELEARIANALV